MLDEFRPGRLNRLVPVREIAGFARTAKAEYHFQLRMDPGEGLLSLSLKTQLWQSSLNWEGQRQGAEQEIDCHYEVIFPNRSLDDLRCCYEEPSLENLFSRIAVRSPGFLDVVEHFNSFFHINFN